MAGVVSFGVIRRKLTITGVKYYCTAGIEFKDFNVGFLQCTFLCITLKCSFSIKSGIPSKTFGKPPSNLGFLEAQSPFRFAVCCCRSLCIIQDMRKLISSSFHRLNMTLAVAEALNPNKPNL